MSGKAAGTKHCPKCTPATASNYCCNDADAVALKATGTCDKSKKLDPSDCSCSNKVPRKEIRTCICGVGDNVKPLCLPCGEPFTPSASTALSSSYSCACNNIEIEDSDFSGTFDQDEGEAKCNTMNVRIINPTFECPMPVETAEHPEHDDTRRHGHHHPGGIGGNSTCNYPSDRTKTTRIDTKDVYGCYSKELHPKHHDKGHIAQHTHSSVRYQKLDLQHYRTPARCDWNSTQTDACYCTFDFIPPSTYSPPTDSDDMRHRCGGG